MLKNPLLVMKRSLALLALTGALAGCMSVPPEIQGTSATPQMDLVRVMNAPSLYVGQESRFGGRVVGVRTEPDRTRLEISTLPLDDIGRPQLSSPSEGRIVAYVKGFLEPIDFKNQLVTVVGPISGTEQGKIGERDYRYVVVNTQGYKRWRVVQQAVLPPSPFYDPWWGPYHRGWGPGWDFDRTVRMETVVTE